MSWYNGTPAGMPVGVVTTTGANIGGFVEVSVTDAANQGILPGQTIGLKDLQDTPSVKIDGSATLMAGEGMVLRMSDNGPAWVTLEPQLPEPYIDETVEHFKEKGWEFAMLPPDLTEELLDGKVTVMVHRDNGDDVPLKIAKTKDGAVLLYEDED